MDAHKLQVKLFAAGTPGLELESYIPIFHGWVKHHTLPELLIDVANYAHVPQGPGVALIGHGSDYFIDQGKGRLGLLYSRKRSAPPPAERLADAFRRALHAAMLLEKEPALAGKLRFGTGELLFRINDRLAAPATDETFAAVKPALDALGARLFAGGRFETTRAGSARELFGVKLASDGKATLAELLDRLGGPPGPDLSLSRA
jgi:hypothetical protein